MELAGKVAVITGGAGGIGRAVAQRFVEERIGGVAVVDLATDRIEAVAAELGDAVLGVVADAADLDQLTAAVHETEARYGPVDLFCANAGIATLGSIDTPDDIWQAAWRVNVMSHVVAARVMIPRWLERGGGYLLTTASAAGLLTNLGDAPYTATKHAAVGLSEWLAITYGDRGIKVSCLCPQGVKTDMLLGGAGDLAAEVVLAQGAIEPETVADAVVTGIGDERFLILPHPEVADYVQRKTSDVDRWLRGMRRLQARFSGG